MIKADSYEILHILHLRGGNRCTPLNTVRIAEGNPRHFLLVRSCFNGRLTVVGRSSRVSIIATPCNAITGQQGHTNKGRTKENFRLKHGRSTEDFSFAEASEARRKREGRGAGGLPKQRRSKESAMKTVKRPHPRLHIKRASTVRGSNRIATPANSANGARWPDVRRS